MTRSRPRPSNAPDGQHPLTRVAVARGKYAKGFQKGQENAPLAYQIRELRAALTRVYATDAHLVAYLVDGLERQPRVSKPGLELYGRRLTVECFFCDVDNPGHTPWTDELFEAARAQDTTLPSLSTAGVYYTRHGRRIVQPLATPLPVESVETRLAAWLLRLKQEGLAVDWACRDWTRHYRLPNVPREAGGRSRCINLEFMKAIELPPLPSPEENPTSNESARPTESTPVRAPLRRRQVGEWTGTLPEPWRPIAVALAQAMPEVTTEWHSPFMALSGALLGRGLPPEHLPAMIGAISMLTGRDDRIEDRHTLAKTTALRWQQRFPITGYTTLAAQWPKLAEALDEAFASAAEAKLREQAREQHGAARPLSLEETTRALEEAIAHAPPGLTLIKAECGLGKTQAALRVAAQRAAKPHADPKALDVRAPAGSKTALSVDKNRLARQCVAVLAGHEQPALRVFGPLSLKDDEGEPVCQFHAIAEPLVAGGLRMQWELCERRGSEEKCPHYAGCAARLGYEGQDHARIVLGTHALLGELDGAAGTTGLLVIDEVQEYLETTTLSPWQLALAEEKALHWFDGVFVGAMYPAIVAARAYLDAAPEEQPLDARKALSRHEEDVPLEDREQAQRSSGVPGDLVACAAAAPFPKRHHGTAPPVLGTAIERVLGGFASSHEVGAVALVLKTLHHAVASEYPVSMRVERRGEERVLQVTAPREQLARALRRDGSVVVLDANVDLQAPVLGRIVGYDPPLHHFTAPDGAPIERTLIRTRHATRRQWFRQGVLQSTKGLGFALKAVVDWACEDPTARTLGLVTFAALEVALRYAADLDPSECRERWKALGQPSTSLETFSRDLAPMLARWPGTLLVAHYGAVRGLNDMADCDALATLGDPWTHLGAAQSDAAFLGLGDTWEPRYEAYCRAELEQAHGRLRTVHRQRPGRALHVGAVLPSGLGWTSGTVQFRALEGGGLQPTASMTAEAFAMAVKGLGGMRAAARVLGRGVATISRYVSGERPVPAEVASMLADALTPASGRRTVPDPP